MRPLIFYQNKKINTSASNLDRYIPQALLIYPSKGNVSIGLEMATISFLGMDGYKVIPTNQSIVTLNQLVMDGIYMDSDLGLIRYQSHIRPPYIWNMPKSSTGRCFEEEK